MEEVLYKPSPWQERFHNTQASEILGAGSAGPGKSVALRMDVVPRILIEHNRCLPLNAPAIPGFGLSADYIKMLRTKFPLRMGDSRGWALHLRREYPMLKHTLREFHRIIPRIDEGAKWSAVDSMFVMSSGYRLQIGSCKEEKDAENYRSSEFDHIAFDELTQFTLEQYENIVSRLRSSDPVLRKMLRVCAMTNPGGSDDPNHPDWVRARFIDHAPEGNRLLKKKITSRDGTVSYKTRIYLPATLFDNPDKEFVREYELNLLDRPAHIRQALLYGNWYATIGSFFGEDWISHLHEVEPFRIPNDWPIFRAMDWGYKSQGVVLWFAVDYDHNLICFKEYSFKMTSATDVAKEIKRVEKDMGVWSKGKSMLTGPADTQLWEERGESGVSKAQEMMDVGVSWRRADKRSRARNAERVLQLLRDHHDGTAQPGLVFFKNCRKCIQTIPSIKPDKNSSEEPQKGGDDHWLDTVMYACAYASRGPEFIGSVTKHGHLSNEDEDDEDRDVPQVERGVSGYGM